jgi:protein-tyrosine-phosphatase
MRILFVCTGNICRSPLAVAVARQEIERAGYDGVEVESAGVAALVGSPATTQASTVAREHGASLDGHRARQLTPELLAATDLVVGMERHHAERAMLLGAREAITVGSKDVPDPYGFGVDAYLDTWTLLADAIPELLANRCAPRG